MEELARLLGEAWRGAVRGYQERVERMETALGEARQRLGRAVQGARQGHLELQQLQAERGGLQERRAALEQRLEGRWQEQLRATEKFQVRRWGTWGETRLRKVPTGLRTFWGREWEVGVEGGWLPIQGPLLRKLIAGAGGPRLSQLPLE